MPTRFSGDIPPGYGQCQCLLWFAGPWNAVGCLQGLLLIGRGEGGRVRLQSSLLVWVDLKTHQNADNLLLCKISCKHSLPWSVDLFGLKMFAVCMNWCQAVPRELLVPDSHWIKKSRDDPIFPKENDLNPNQSCGVTHRVCV